MSHKNYNEIHHSLGNDETGKRAWLKPVIKASKSLDEKTVNDMNAQFNNTGIKYVEVENEKTDKNIAETETTIEEPKI